MLSHSVVLFDAIFFLLKYVFTLLRIWAYISEVSTAFYPTFPKSPPQFTLHFRSLHRNLPYISEVSIAFYPTFPKSPPHFTLHFRSLHRNLSYISEVSTAFYRAFPKSPPQLTLHFRTVQWNIDLVYFSFRKLDFDFLFAVAIRGYISKRRIRKLKHDWL
jgi:hypothetical protein